MTTPQIRRLQAAVIDGRAHNVFFRQTQLERLYKGLLAKEGVLREAMVSDVKYTPSEAIAILHVSLKAVRDAYISLQPPDVQDREYRIANNKDAPDNLVPFGLVYIEPESHTLLYSVCSALSSAIAAGNCVALLLENTLRALPKIIRKVLTEALDADTLAVVTAPLKDRETFNSALTVSSGSRADGVSLRSKPVAVAVVDRTADIRLAAQEIAQARTAFGGNSPYVPRTVLVNEFVMGSFIDALLATTAQSSFDIPLDRKAGERCTKSVVEVDLKKGTIIPCNARTLQTKADELSFVVWSVRSLDDAINLLDEQQHPFQAAYHFSDLRSAKYLSQFVDAEVTFVNQIPRTVLIGPVPPRSQHVLDSSRRYSTSLFSRSRPVFVQTTAEDQRLATVLSSEDNKVAQTLLAEATLPMKVMKRSEGGGVGFFEQGFLMYASFILISFVALSATGAWQLWRYRSS